MKVIERLKLLLLAGIFLVLLALNVHHHRDPHAVTADDDDGFSPCIDMVKR